MKHQKIQSLELNNVSLWNADGQIDRCNLTIQNGVLEKITPLDDSTATIPTTVVMPVGVDPQVHFRSPGQPDKETPATGMAAAIAGGYGAVLTMPNTKPVIDHPQVVRETIELFNLPEFHEFKTLISGAISKEQKSQEGLDYQSLADAGIAAYTDDGYGVHSDDIMRQVFAASEKTGLPVLQHAETLGHGGVLAPSEFQKEIGVKAYPDVAESDMVARDIELLKDFPKARYHVLHVSCPRSVELVQEAKDAGLLATCEVSPHHLYFSSDEISAQSTSFKMNPPIRSAEYREYLQKALAEGKIDFVATDHAPHESTAKGSSFKTAAYGTTGLETSLRVLLFLYRQNKLSAGKLVEVFSSAGANFLNLADAGYGELRQGQPFRAVVVKDIHTDFKVVEKDLYSKSKNNCFLGAPLPARISKVYLKDSCYSLS